jgi:hypothetical protein
VSIAPASQAVAVGGASGSVAVTRAALPVDGREQRVVDHGRRAADPGDGGFTVDANATGASAARSRSPDRSLYRRPAGRVRWRRRLQRTNQSPIDSAGQRSRIGLPVILNRGESIPHHSPVVKVRVDSTTFYYVTAARVRAQKAL